jgi:cytidylate kinase
MNGKMAILTVSREFGSGAGEIGLFVAGELGYTYFDRDRFFSEMRARGKKWEEWAKSFDERSPTVWERYDWSFRGFVALTRSILLEHAARDNTVIIGRGGNFLLQGAPHAFRIRVTAPLEARIDQVMARESVDYDTAKWLIVRTDRERSRFVLALIGKDWSDPGAFDAIFDTGSRPIEEIVHTICETLRHRDHLKTDEAQKDMCLHVQAAKLEAALFTYPHLFLSTLEVCVEQGQMVLRCIVRDPKQKRQVEEIATKLAGNVPLKFDLHYRL